MDMLAAGNALAGSPCSPLQLRLASLCLCAPDASSLFSGQPYFQTVEGKRALFHVLNAYAVHDPEVGYCQV